MFWRPLPLLGIWIAAGVALSALTGRVRDWFVMTDELLYTRFAINSARDLTPVAHLHGEVVQSLAQLYPVLIAPLFRGGFVAENLHDARVFNAWLMSSACIPAYLLARRVTGHVRASYAFAVIVVVIPSMVYASYALTEVVAYPAFLWALLAMERAIASPSRRNDLLVLLAIGVAFFSRTQFVILALALPLALIAHAFLQAEHGWSRRSVRTALRTAVGRHRILGSVYGFFLAAAIGLGLSGRLGAVLGVYSSTLTGGIPPHLASSLLTHLATVALGIGILPGIIGVAWVVANVVRMPGGSDASAFACVAATTLLLLVPEVAIFDLRIGAGPIVYDRYLFYLAPILLLGTLCALFRPGALTGAPRVICLACASLLVAGGFALNDPPRFVWQQFPALSPDAPITTVYAPIARFTGGIGAARWSGAILAMALAALVAYCWGRAGGRLVTAAVAISFAVIPMETYYVFHRLLTEKDWASRPIGYQAHGTEDWIDAALGARAEVTQIPSPVSSDYLINQQAWRDLEFWNKSVQRTAALGTLDAFRYTGNAFPRVLLTIDTSTGLLNASPTPWVAQSDKDTRFAIAGDSVANSHDIVLTRAEMPWRAQWMSFGLYDDGWTRPNETARIRIFATPGQAQPEMRYLTFFARPPSDDLPRVVRIVSNADRRVMLVTNATAAPTQVPVCVPPRGYAEVRITSKANSDIPADLGSMEQPATTRQGGVYFGFMAVSQGGAPCAT